MRLRNKTLDESNSLLTGDTVWPRLICTAVFQVNKLSGKSPRAKCDTDGALELLVSQTIQLQQTSLLQINPSIKMFAGKKRNEPNFLVTQNQMKPITGGRHGLLNPCQHPHLTVEPFTWDHRSRTYFHSSLHYQWACLKRHELSWTACLEGFSSMFALNTPKDIDPNRCFSHYIYTNPSHKQWLRFNCNLFFSFFFFFLRILENWNCYVELLSSVATCKEAGGGLH